MKHLFPLLLLALLSSCARFRIPANAFPDPFEFEMVDSVAGVSKEALYIRARTWMAYIYGSSKQVVEMEDKAAGKIVGKAAIGWPGRKNGTTLCESQIHYIIAIDVKEGRYRCVLSDYRHEGCRYYTKHENGLTPDGGELDMIEQPRRAGMDNKEWYNLKQKAASDAETLLRGLKAAMHNASQDSW